MVQNTNAYKIHWIYSTSEKSTLSLTHNYVIIYSLDLELFVSCLWMWQTLLNGAGILKYPHYLHIIGSFILINRVLCLLTLCEQKTVQLYIVIMLIYTYYLVWWHVQKSKIDYEEHPKLHFLHFYWLILDAVSQWQVPFNPLWILK